MVLLSHCPHSEVVASALEGVWTATVTVMRLSSMKSVVTMDVSFRDRKRFLRNFFIGRKKTSSANLVQKLFCVSVSDEVVCYDAQQISVFSASVLRIFKKDSNSFQADIMSV